MNDRPAGNPDRVAPPAAPGADVTGRPARRGEPGRAMADRRTEILSVATRRFAEFGFEATTVRQIADDVKILSGSLYHHFATKDAMLHEIVCGAAQQLRDNTARIAGLPVDAEYRLVALILLELGELIRDREAYAILSNERKMFRDREEFAYVVEAKKAAYLAWRIILEDGIKTQLFKPGLDVYLTISTVARMLSAAADWYQNEDMYVSGNRFSHSLDQMIDFYLDFVLGAVRLASRAAAPIPRAACEALLARPEAA